MRNVSRRNPNEHSATVCIFPPLVGEEPQRDCVQIFESDMKKLDEGKFLNDSLVDFDLKYLHNNAM